MLTKICFNFVRLDSKYHLIFFSLLAVKNRIDVDGAWHFLCI